jgi:MFS family permease
MHNLQLTFYWIRWLLLLPFSIGIGLAISSLVSVALSFVVHNYDLTQFNSGSRAFITSSLSIILAYVIAPKYKHRAVVGLYFLWALGLTFCLTIAICKIKLYGVEWEIKDCGIALIMILIGLTFSYLILFIIPKRRIELHNVIQNEGHTP